MEETFESSSMSYSFPKIQKSPKATFQILDLMWQGLKAWLGGVLRGCMMEPGAEDDWQSFTCKLCSFHMKGKLQGNERMGPSEWTAFVFWAWLTPTAFFLHFHSKILDPPNASPHRSFAALREEWDMEAWVPCLSAWNPGWPVARHLRSSPVSRRVASGLSDIPSFS